MKYVDLHCDALTKTEGVFQVTKETLRRGGCLLQCFAAFVDQGEYAPGERYARAVSLCEAFDEMCGREGYNPVRKFSDLREGRLNAMLTAEEGGAIEGSLEKLEDLYRRGVRMMTLTWNYRNEIGTPASPVSMEEGGKERGLTAFGRRAAERMQELGMIIDVSHASGEVFADVAEISGRSKIPFVASHSNAAGVFPHPRNLTDGEIRMLADRGGVTGLNLFADFLSADRTQEGQREALLAHARHILRTGGEDVLALGTDFDGIPANPYVQSAAELPRLLRTLSDGLGPRIAEKIACGNALRVLREVLSRAS